MKKIIRDGKVAILYSPSFGAGWYTWNTEHPECIFDPDVVQWVESNKENVIDDLIKSKYGENFYCGGMYDLEIEWLKEGTHFCIEEYDGSESIKLIQDLDIVA